MKNLSGAEDFLVEDFSFIPCTPVNMVASYLKFKLYAERRAGRIPGSGTYEGRLRNPLRQCGAQSFSKARIRTVLKRAYGCFT